MSSQEKPSNFSNSPEELEKNIKRKESEEELGPIQSKAEKKENKEKLKEQIELLRKSLGL
jgi:hypothetical protein